MSFLAGLLTALIPLLLLLRMSGRIRVCGLALCDRVGRVRLSNDRFRTLDPGLARRILQERDLPGLMRITLPLAGGWRLVLANPVAAGAADRPGLMEHLLLRFEEGGAVHRMLQLALEDARQSLGVVYLDQLLGNPAEDEIRDPFVDTESYREGEEALLLDWLSRLSREGREYQLHWAAVSTPDPASAALVAFMAQRGLDCLLAVPFRGGGAWRGGLVVGWAPGQCDAARLQLALELCVLLQTQLQNRRTLRQLKLLNRELREDLSLKARRTRDLEQELLNRQQKLEAASREAAEASRLKSEFLASMSHELRTPLNAIKGYTSIVLKEEGLSARQQLSLERVRTSSDTLLKLINDILDYSRMESGKLALDLELVNASAICRETVAHLEPLAQERELGFQLTADGSDIHAVLDRSKLERILINLLGNAIKFTDRGSVGLWVFRREGMVVFEVRDTGIGIHPEERELIFQHFRQGDGSTRRQHGGTGLGLAITARLVELLGGRIELDSELGRGSTFRVYLPIFLDLDTARQVLSHRAETHQPA